MQTAIEELFIPQGAIKPVNWTPFVCLQEMEPLTRCMSNVTDSCYKEISICETSSDNELWTFVFGRTLDLHLNCRPGTTTWGSIGRKTKGDRLWGDGKRIRAEKNRRKEEKKHLKLKWQEGKVTLVSKFLRMKEFCTKITSNNFP